MSLLDKEYMTQLISVDMDLPPVARWVSMAAFMPELADFLARKYGTKEEQKMMKKLFKKKKASTNE